MSCVLVIGATGILAPAVDSLLARGSDVVAVARGGGRLRALRASRPSTHGQVHTLAGDATDPSFTYALERYVGDSDLTLSGAAFYAPATSIAVAVRLSSIVRGPVVEVLTSTVAAPPPDGRTWSIDRLAANEPMHARLVLGWRCEPGRTRWHTPEEISAAVIDLLCEPQDHLLGTVTPWDERP